MKAIMEVNCFTIFYLFLIIKFLNFNNFLCQIYIDEFFNNFVFRILLLLLDIEINTENNI